jgi:hypothetical protein
MVTPPLVPGSTRFLDSFHTEVLIHLHIIGALHPKNGVSLSHCGSAPLSALQWHLDRLRPVDECPYGRGHISLIIVECRAHCKTGSLIDGGRTKVDVMDMAFMILFSLLGSRLFAI